MSKFSSRAVTAESSRAEIRNAQLCSAVRSADRTMRSTRTVVGGSIRSARNCASSSSRTRSGRRSAWATLLASHAVNFSWSLIVATRNSRCARIWLR